MDVDCCSDAQYQRLQQSMSACHHGPGISAHGYVQLYKYVMRAGNAFTVSNRAYILLIICTLAYSYFNVGIVTVLSARVIMNVMV